MAKFGWLDPEGRAGDTFLPLSANVRARSASVHIPLNVKLFSSESPLTGAHLGQSLLNYYGIFVSLNMHHREIFIYNIFNVLASTSILQLSKLFYYSNNKFFFWFI